MTGNPLIYRYLGRNRLWCGLQLCTRLIYINWHERGEKAEIKALQTKTDLHSACNNSPVWIHTNKSEANFVSIPNKLSHQQHFTLVTLYCLHRGWNRKWKEWENARVEPDIAYRDITGKRVRQVPVCGGWLCLVLHWVKHRRGHHAS
jgi:hypothetical protein